MDYAKNRIARLVADYTKQRRIADQYFVDQVLTLLVNALSVNDFVLNIKYDVDQDLLGAYDLFTKTVHIDIERLNNHINDKLKKEIFNGIRSSEIDLLLKYNLAFVNAIAHEVYHALQYKKVFFNQELLETKLLRLSFEHNLMVYSMESNEKYLTDDEVEYILMLGKLEEEPVYLDALPSERNAFISASKLEKDVATIIGQHDRVQEYLKLKYQTEQIRGYLNGNCPTAYVMSVHNKLKNAYGLSSSLPERLHENEVICQNIADGLDLSLEDRFYYGFYVNDEELRPRIDSINTLTRKITNNS